MSVSKQGAVGVTEFYPSANGSLNSSTLDVRTQLDGFVAINVSAVDVAGNQDPTPFALSIVVLSGVPDVTLQVPPPVLTNSSSVSFNVSSDNVDRALLTGFVVTSTPAIASLQVTQTIGLPVVAV